MKIGLSERPPMPYNLAELINTGNHKLVVDGIMYFGWEVPEIILDMLKEKLDAPSYRAVLKKTRIVNP